MVSVRRNDNRGIEAENIQKSQHTDFNDTAIGQDADFDPPHLYVVPP